MSHPAEAVRGGWGSDCDLKQAVSQGRLPVVNVCDDAEIPDLARRNLQWAEDGGAVSDADRRFAACKAHGFLACVGGGRVPCCSRYSALRLPCAPHVTF